MSNTTNTNTSETNPQASELCGTELSLLTALSVTLILLTMFLFFFWQYKKQQRRDMNRTNSSTTAEVNCHKGSEAAMEIPSLPIFIQLSTDPAELRDCAICLAEIGVGNSGQILPACGHVFHKECIGLWFQYHSTCPVCRANILKTSC